MLLLSGKIWKDIRLVTKSRKTITKSQSKHKRSLILRTIAPLVLKCLTLISISMIMTLSLKIRRRKHKKRHMKLSQSLLVHTLSLKIRSTKKPMPKLHSQPLKLFQHQQQFRLLCLHPQSPLQVPKHQFILRRRSILNTLSLSLILQRGRPLKEQALSSASTPRRSSVSSKLETS